MKYDTPDHPKHY